MENEARIREEIRSKLIARLAQAASQTCDVCRKPFGIYELTLVESSFICNHCLFSQVDRGADAVLQFGSGHHFKLSGSADERL